MNKQITVIEGDGIGPEVTKQSVKVLNAIAERFGHEFDYTYQLMGAIAIDKTGNHDSTEHQQKPHILLARHIDCAARCGAGDLRSGLAPTGQTAI